MLNSMSLHTWPCCFNHTVGLWSRAGGTSPPSLKTKGTRGKTCLESITYQQPPHMGSGKSQGGMGRCPGQNAGMLCRLSYIQGSTSLGTWKSIINKTILLLQNPPKTLKMHYNLQGSWTFNFHPVYEKRLFLVIKENQSWSILTLLTPRAALSILQSLPPLVHMFILFVQHVPLIKISGRQVCMDT